MSLEVDPAKQHVTQRPTACCPLPFDLLRVWDKGQCSRALSPRLSHVVLSQETVSNTQRETVTAP